MVPDGPEFDLRKNTPFPQCGHHKLSYSMYKRKMTSSRKEVRNAQEMTGVLSLMATDLCQLE
jgi:hypothetical protein